MGALGKGVIKEIIMTRINSSLITNINLECSYSLLIGTQIGEKSKLCAE
jgi:hypothetical protein